MREPMKAGLVPVLLAVLVACGEPSAVRDARSTSMATAEALAEATAEARADQQTPPTAGPVTTP